MSVVETGPDRRSLCSNGCLSPRGARRALTSNHPQAEHTARSLAKSYGEKEIASGKAMDIPEQRRFPDQKHCAYEPHILIVSQNGPLQIKSSDPVLHTVHMDGAASFNLPFPFVDRVVSRNMPNVGLVNLKCNGGHVWMNAEVLAVPHPYYTVTDITGKFELTGVPPGQYQLVAWHEGWSILRQEGMFDVLTESKVERPVFSEPRTWEQKVSVSANGASTANFVLSER